MIVAPLLGLVALGVIAGFFVCWILAFIKLFRRQPFLPYEPRRPVPWGLVDLGLVIVVLLLAAVSSSYLLKSQFGPEAGTENQPFTLQQNMLIILADTAMKVATDAAEAIRNPSMLNASSKRYAPAYNPASWAPFG